MPNVTSFDRIAAVAARQFVADGYAAVSLRSIAAELEIKPASLYYHCPRGKTELFARALSSYLDGYRTELTASAGRSRFPRAVFRMADWMLEHPPIDLQRIIRTDLAHLAPEDAELVTQALHDSVLGPFVEAFEDAGGHSDARGDIDPSIAASAVVALVSGLGFQHLPAGRPPIASELRAARSTVHRGLEMLRGLG